MAAVLGGAGGIGREVAAALLACGAYVIVADLDESRAAKVVAELDDTGLRCRSALCDVRSIDSLQRIADEAAASGRPVDLLLYFVGISVGGYPEMIPPDIWAEIIDVNVTGAARAVTAFAPTMLAKGAGWIVLASSTLALHPVTSPLSSPYVTSKTALLGLGASLDSSLRPRGVGVTVLAPGMTATDFAESATRWLPQGKVQVRADLRGADTPSAVADRLIEGLMAGERLITMPSWSQQHERLVAELAGPALYMERQIPGPDGSSLNGANWDD